MVGTGYLILVSGYWLLVAGCWGFNPLRNSAKTQRAFA